MRKALLLKIWIIAPVALFFCAIFFMICTHHFNNRAFASPKFKQSQLEAYMNAKYDVKNFNGCTVTIVFHQPVKASRIAINSFLYAGHAFLRIAKHGEHGWISYIGYRANEINDGGMMTGEMLWQDDASSEWSVGKAFIIKENEALSLLEFAKRWGQNLEYNLGSRNCATFAVEALSSIGINASRTGIKPHKFNIPNDLSDITAYAKENIKNINQLEGFSPADAAEDMKLTPDCIFP